MPRHLISDAHEWINEIPTVPVYYPAKPQPRERAWQNQRGKKTLLSLTLTQDSLQRVNLGGGHCQVGCLAGAAHLLNDNAGGGSNLSDKGRISVDRGSKATQPLTIPRRVFKSSAKDSTCRSVAVRTALPPNRLSQRHVPLGAEAPTDGRQLGGGCMRHF
ncbi:hypothetical protein YC2023_072139 [Brassica napus]